MSHTPIIAELQIAVVTIDNTDSPYSVGQESVINCNAAGGVITVNLPAAASNADRIMFIKKTDSSANAVTIDGNASETIDGDATKILSVQYEALPIVCDGSNWTIPG
jgi:hypothetical protein